MELSRLGWAAPFKTAFETSTQRDLVPGRVVNAQRELYRVLCSDGICDAHVSGRLRHEADSGGLPVVGDWVALRRSQAASSATIAWVLPRKSVLARKRPERAVEQQLMAANLDYVFVVSALNLDFSPRRIERALAMIWEGGAQPVVVLTKLDVCGDPEPYLDAARAVSIGVDVHAVSVHTDRGLGPLRAYAARDRSLALIGSSGVGKSTLVNWFLGEARAAISEARAADDKGRHTTTARELFVLPDGGVLIDTPGMRELALWDAAEGLETTFDDVHQLARTCRFGDCTHANEPGCAVRSALADGQLSQARWLAYGKLQRELAYEARRHDQRSQLEHQRKWKRLARIRAKDSRTHRKR